MITRISSPLWQLFTLWGVCIQGMAALHASATRLVDSDSVWRYWDGQALPGSAALTWKSHDFDDQDWKEGIGPFGYGEGNEQTVLDYGPKSNEKQISYYFRHTFTVDDPTSLSAVALAFRVDDGAVIYLNGREVSRYNMQYVDNDVRRTITGSEEEVWHRNVLASRHLVAGENVLAIEVQQIQGDSSDLRFEAHLTGIGTGLVGESAKIPHQGDFTMSQGVHTMSRSGNTMAFGYDDSTRGTGRVEIYELLVDGAWAFRQQLVLEDALPGDAFGTGLAFHGDTLLASLPGRSTSANGKNSTGGVAIFRRRADTGYQFSSYIFPPGDAADVRNFGQSIAVDEDELLIGAPNGGGLGYAFLYRFGQGEWQYQERFAPEGHVRPGFGQHVTLEGDHSVIGATSGGVDSPGALYFYQRSAGVWELDKVIELMDPLGSPFDSFFGGPLVLQGNTLIAGWPRTSGDDRTGRILVYKRGLFGWPSQAQILGGDVRFGGTFGRAFDLHGNLLAVTETSEAGLRDMRGGSRIHLYTRNSSAAPWTHRETVVEDLPEGYASRDPVVLLDGDGLTAWGMVADRDMLAFHYPISAEGAPVFLTTPAATASPGAVYRYEIAVTPASEELQLEVANLPAWLSFASTGTPGSAVIEGTPDLGDAGDHVITVTATMGETSSQQFVRIRVAAEIAPPVITIQPQDETTITGRTVRFVVGLAGAQPADVIWWRNDKPLETETGLVLTLTNVSDTNSGTYWAEITNAGGVQETRRATLKVTNADPATSVLVPDDEVSIAEALEAAGEGFEIFVKSGSYVGKDLEIAQNKTLRSLEGPEQTALTEVSILVMENARLEGFRLEGGTYRGVRTSSAQIVNNLFAGTAETMLEVNLRTAPEAPATIIERNHFIGDYQRDNGETAILLDDSEVRIVNNVFSHVRLGIATNDSEFRALDQIEISQNTFNACRQALDLRTNEGFEIANNLFFFVDDAIIRRPLDKFQDLSTVHHNVFFEVTRPLDGNPVPLEAHGNRSGDPRLHNPSGRHLHLSPESIAIDVGGMLSAGPDTDMLGRARAIGAAPDAGAYEFVPGEEIAPPELRADAPVVRLIGLSTQHPWTEIALEGWGEMWRVDPPPPGIEVFAQEGTLPGTLRVRRGEDVSLSRSDRLTLHSGDTTLHLPLWYEPFAIDSRTKVFPLNDGTSRHLIVSRDWIGYWMADGQILPHRIRSSIGDADFHGDKIYLMHDTGKVSEVDVLTLAEVKAYPTSSSPLALQVRSDGKVLVSNRTCIEAYEDGEFVWTSRLEGFDAISSVFSADGFELLIISHSHQPLESVFHRVRLGESEILSVDSFPVAPTQSYAPLRRSPSGNHYYWNSLLIDAATLEVTEMGEEITGLSTDDTFVILQTELVNLGTGVRGPLPWSVSWGFDTGEELLLLSPAGIMTFDPTGGMADGERLAIDSWAAAPGSEHLALGFRIRSPGELYVVETSSDGKTWQSLSENEIESSGATEDHGHYLILKPTDRRRFYRVRETDE